MPARLHFGRKKLNDVGRVVKRHGRRCLLVTTINEAPLKDLYDRVKTLLESSDIEAIHFDEVQPNPTVEIVESGIQMFNEFHCDVILAVGGGSSIDTAKAIALLYNQHDINWSELFAKYDAPFEAYDKITEHHVPMISIPTTAGTGSEVTQATVLSYGDDKLTIFHPDNFSVVAILDPELLLTLPNFITAATGFDAFSHAFESFISVHSSPLTEMMAYKAMALVVSYLPLALKDPKNTAYREHLMLAEMMAGMSLSNAGADAPHPISEVIGGLTHISHGEALALVFPEFIEIMSEKHRDKFAVIASMFDMGDLSGGIKKFLKDIDMYKSWSDHKISEETFTKIYECPVWGFLPFGTEEEMKLILIKSFNRR